MKEQLHEEIFYVICKSDPEVGKRQMQKVAAAAGVPCDVIPMADYGMVNGKNVLAFAKKLANA